MTNGVAHVSFRGGSLFLPARTPYDRQALLDHVGAYLRATGEVQVLFGESRWMVHVERRALPVYCLGCTAPIDAGWYCPDDGGRTYCAKCALGGSPSGTRLHELQTGERRSGGALQRSVAVPGMMLAARSPL